MATATAASKFEQVKYIPHPDRPWPKTASVTDGDGKTYRVELQPRKWTKVPTAVADMLYAKRKRASRPIDAPKGDKIEKRMHTGDPGETVEENYNKYEILFKDRD